MLWPGKLTPLLGVSEAVDLRGEPTMALLNPHNF